jgi:hypothetical protein
MIDEDLVQSFQKLTFENDNHKSENCISKHIQCGLILGKNLTTAAPFLRLDFYVQREFFRLLRRFVF